jgi:peroxiredoxin
MKIAPILTASMVFACPLATLAQDSKAQNSKDSEPVPAFPAAKRKDLHASSDYRGQPAPEFRVGTWLSKEPDRKGKVVLIDFWATWCAPCCRLIPELEIYQSAFKDDLVVIGVSDERPDTIKKFIEDKNITYAIAVDRNRAMYNDLGMRGRPNVIIVDSQGIVRWQGVANSQEEPLTASIIKQIIDADKAANKKGPSDTTPTPPTPPPDQPKDTKKTDKTPAKTETPVKKTGRRAGRGG